ncbi:MAG: hypothetical protein COB98_08030, partial [Flavobacteriaceae bacterium]
MKKNYSIRNLLIILYLAGGSFGVFGQMIIETSLITTTNASIPGDLCSYKDGCSANAVEIHGAYIGLEDGSSITDCSQVANNELVYLFIDVYKNGNKHNFFAQFSVTLSDGNTTLYEVSKTGSIQTGLYKAGPINYICGEEYKLENILISWTANSSGSPSCPIDNNYAHCNGSINGIVANGPLVPQFTYQQDCNNPLNITFTSTSTGGKIKDSSDVLYLDPYKYTWTWENGVTDPQTGYSNANAVFTHTYTNTTNYSVTLSIEDRDGTTKSTTQSITIYPQLTQPTGTVTNVSCTGPNNSGGISAINSTGGSGSYEYDLNNDGNYGSLQSYPEITAGTYTINIRDTTTGCVVTKGFVVGTNTLNTAETTTDLTTCINAPILDITITTTGATNIGIISGLPTGLSATWLNQLITISGTPTTSGIFNYSIPLTGGCGTVNATGTITVDPTSIAGTISTDQTICKNETPNDISITGNTGSIQWKSSTDGTTFTNISGETGTNLSFTSHSATMYYKAVVTNGTCIAVTTNMVTITVDPTSIAGTISADQTICK